MLEALSNNESLKEILFEFRRWVKNKLSFLYCKWNFAFK
jgi:hypothetical protein